MGCGIEPRKEEFCGGRDARNRRRQHVRHRYARCRRSAGVEGHITSERNASEPERSHVRPQAAEPTGPHREGEEPKPMMHGHEKSDSAIVATKPPNKAGRPAAEAVERRAEAKENANRCRTCRTQCRESVSPTPERVRKAEASRQTSEVGAVCRKAARTVLCGGRPVMGVPTAIDRSVPISGQPVRLPSRLTASRPGTGSSESISLQQTVCLSPAVVFEGREPGVPRGSGLLAWRSGRQRRSGFSISHQLAAISLSG